MRWNVPFKGTHVVETPPINADFNPPSALLRPDMKTYTLNHEQFVNYMNLLSFSQVQGNYTTNQQTLWQQKRIFDELLEVSKDAN